jgi:very-short-patch-repair endonuclease
MSERKTLGVSRAAGEGKPDVSTFNVTGARLERLKERAREMRRNPTEAQKVLWTELSGSKLGGVKFTRQAVVGSSVVDFACPSRWIVISLSTADANVEVATLQDKKLSDVGIRVLRFTEEEILGDVEAVVDAVNAEINKPFDKRSARAQFAPRMESAEG